MNRGARLLGWGMAGALALAIPGCGLGAGPGAGGLQLTVTRDFGSRVIGTLSDLSVPGQDTVMRTLERHFTVGTRYGGGFVESIDGVSGTSSRRDWFYYLDGREASVGAAQVLVHAGERVWWDLHDWSAAESVPAVVGQWPAPFAGHSVAVLCALECDPVRAAIRAAGGRPSAARADSPEVVVGSRSDAVAVPVLRLLDEGPGASGVYATLSRTLNLLNPHGGVARRLGPGAGLVAATVLRGRTVWVLSGTDASGIRAAVRALDGGWLENHFALAVTSRGEKIPLPVDPGS